MALVDKRYAEAFVNLAAEKNMLEVYQEDLRAVSEIYEKEEQLRAFLFNPGNTLAARKSLLTGIFEGKIQQDVLNLLLLLEDKGRMKSLPGIYREYVHMANSRRCLLNISIYSAVPIEEARIYNIGEKFRALYNAASTKITVEIDPSLVGGIKVVIGDRLYDGTLKGKLARLHSSLIGQQ